MLQLSLRRLRRPERERERERQRDRETEKENFLPRRWLMQEQGSKYAATSPRSSNSGDVTSRLRRTEGRIVMISSLLYTSIFLGGGCARIRSHMPRDFPFEV
jgi:hypothetical protein